MDRWKCFSANHSPPFHRKWCLPYNNNFLFSEREVFTEKYWTEVFFVQTEPVGRGLNKKTEGRYFSVKTEQAKLIEGPEGGSQSHFPPEILAKSQSQLDFY
jgi:hypothetical protein